MGNRLKNQVKIVPKPDYIGWDELTSLLHKAYKIRAEEGFKFVAYNQSVDKTIKRCNKGNCLVAILDDKLVGTITYTYKENKNKWYRGEKYCFFTQFAVDPDYGRRGIGNKLHETVKKISSDDGASYMGFNTASKAQILINWYEKRGYKYVDFMSHKSTNYYSIEMSIPINGKPYLELYRIFRFVFSKFKCICTRKKNGELRQPAKIIKKLIFNIYENG
ncbi:MAG: GNAT family N-acetyltransferase [Bacteroidota bacterium]